MAWMHTLMTLVLDDEGVVLAVLGRLGLPLDEPVGLVEDPSADAHDAVAYAHALARLGCAREAEEVLAAALARCPALGVAPGRGVRLAASA